MDHINTHTSLIGHCSKLYEYQLFLRLLSLLFLFMFDVALRDKPTTGLGRCRTVGLSRLKPGTRKKSTGFELPLLNFFAYHGRSSPKIPP